MAFPLEMELLEYSDSDEEYQNSFEDREDEDDQHIGRLLSPLSKKSSHNDFNDDKVNPTLQTPGFRNSQAIDNTNPSYSPREEIEERVEEQSGIDPGFSFKK